MFDDKSLSFASRNYGYCLCKCNKRGEALDITYKNKKIEKICTDAKISDRTYGNEMSEKIQMRIGEIEAEDTVEEMLKYRIGRCHTLINNRKVVLGIPAKFWNNLEAVYREKLIKVKAENAMDDDKALDYRTNPA